MKNVIVITSYNKPDLLFLNLEQLFKQPSIFNYDIEVHTETGYNVECHGVVNVYQQKYPQISIKFICKDREKHPCSLVGFHNILSSYWLAAQNAKDYLIILEEDILPTEDYLRFNEEVYKNYLSKYDRIFCVAHKRRPETELIGNPEILIGDYQCTSPSCLTVKAVKRYMGPFLVNPFFYQDVVKFNEYFFPESRIRPHEHTHHDGAIERIMEHYSLFALKPDQTRSMHVGLSGIFCGGTPPQGSLQERIEQWRELIKDGNKLRKLSNRPEDIVVTDPKGPIWQKLELDLDRVRAKASSWWYDINNEFKSYILHQSHPKLTASE